MTPQRPRFSFQGFPPAVRLMGIGWYFATCVILAVVGGVLLDGVFDSRPIFVLLGLVLGLVLAFYGGYQQLTEVLQSVNKRGKGGQ